MAGGLQPQHLGATVSIGRPTHDRVDTDLRVAHDVANPPIDRAHDEPDTAFLSASSTRREAMTTLP